MLIYHFLRNNLASEEAFLQKQAARGRMLTRIRGARYKFVNRTVRGDEHFQAYLRLTKDRYDAVDQADQVVTVQLSRELYYNVLYTKGNRVPRLQSNPEAEEQFHVYMLDHGARQEWKGGIGLFMGLMLFTVQAALAHSGGFMGTLPIRALFVAGSIALVAASLRGLFIGLRNSITSVHPDKKPAPLKTKRV